MTLYQNLTLEQKKRYKLNAKLKRESNPILYQKYLDSKRDEYQRHKEGYLRRALDWNRKNPEKRKYIQSKLLNYKGKTIMMPNPVRTGICKECGNIGRTNIHHKEYDDSNPLAYTIELCIRCHNKAHGWRRSK